MTLSACHICSPTITTSVLTDAVRFKSRSSSHTFQGGAKTESQHGGGSHFSQQVNLKSRKEKRCGGKEDSPSLQVPPGPAQCINRGGLEIEFFTLDYSGFDDSFLKYI